MRQGWRVLNVALFAVGFWLALRNHAWIEAGVVGFFLLFAIVILVIWLYLERRDAAR